MASDRRGGVCPLVFGGDVPARGATTRAARLCEPGSLDAVRGRQRDRPLRARGDRESQQEHRGRPGRRARDDPGEHRPRRHQRRCPRRCRPCTSTRDLAPSSATTSRRRDARPRRSTRRPRTPPHPHTLPAFSGRGPVIADNGAALMPDVAAPGTTSSLQWRRRSTSAVSGTSTRARRWRLRRSPASPRFVAGEHPDWSPAAIKSAIVTTARPIASGAGAFAAGAGAIDPSRAGDPGLVYDAGPDAGGPTRRPCRSPRSRASTTVTRRRHRRRGRARDVHRNGQRAPRRRRPRHAVDASRSRPARPSGSA